MRASIKGRWATAALSTGALVALAASGVTPASAARLSPVNSSSGSACVPTPGAYGCLPPESGTPASGGIVTIAENPGAGPNYIFPITPASNLSVYDVEQFQQYMWPELWWSPSGDEATIDYALSMGRPPVFSDANKTVTIKINPGWKWSDGTPVTSEDLAFDFWLTLAAVTISPANDGDFTPGLYPDGTTVSTPNPSTLVVHFTRTYNANFDQLEQLGALEALPAQAWSKTSATGKIIPFDNIANAKAIYTYLNAQSKDLSTYGTNPLWQVVDGPFKISSFTPATDANTLVANPAYSGPGKPHIAGIDEVAFTSTSSELDQLMTRNLDVGYLLASDLPQVKALESKGYSVWGYPDLGFQYIAYNFKDPTGDFGKIISQLYVRQAIAHLQDEPALIKSRGVFDGAAGLAYGPAPAVPTTPFTPSNALSNPYPYSIVEAAKLLSSHGWKVVTGGTTTCQRPGTAADECGAGIPKGTPMTWDLIYSNSPAVIGTQDEVLASAAKQVGISIKLISKTFNYITSELSDVSNPTHDKLWAMEDFGGFTDDLYPTTDELFNTTGSFNQGGFSDPAINTAIHNSEYSLSSDAVKTELGLVTAAQPGLFQPNPDLVYAYKDTLSGPPSSFESASDYQYEPNYWYFKK